MATCGACDKSPTLSWQRWATEDEIEQLHASDDLPADEETAKLIVLACDDHAITPELAAATHASACSAPSTCDCGATPPPPDMPVHQEV